MNLNLSAPGHLLDLIYTQNRKERVEEVKPLFHSGHMVLPPKLHRVTMFLTFRCNLRCVYCNTIRPTKGAPWPTKNKEYDLEQFRAVVDQLAPYNIQHMHLTGGEATLVKGLPDMVAQLSQKGIPCSLTTNGTADPALYRELVKKGVREIRISCDTHIPEDFDRTVRRKGTYQEVIKTIRELVRLRDEDGRDIYIILNICVGHDNRERIVESIKQSIALRPNDVKLIGISHERADLARFEDRHRVVEEVRMHLNTFPRGQFPLLRLKLKTIFARDTYGFEDLTSQRLMQNCFIPLTERIVDHDYYYPCPLFVREGGVPLGRLDKDDFKTQQEKIVEFVKAESCLDDPICGQYCINCCKKFNLHANAKINETVRGPSGQWEPIALSAEFKREITNADVLVTMKKIAEERDRFAEEIPYQPFLVIKPSGTPHAEQIMTRLQAEKITVARKAEIPDWNDVALRLYSVPLTEERVFRGLLLKRALPQVEETTRGELWILAGDYSFSQLDRLKKDVRAILPPSQCLIFCQDELVVTTLGYLHSPSETNYTIEANLLLPGLRHPVELVKDR
ncbi:MAG: radical SAM protein [Thermodesulfobacteriota bacterium]|nr:radical SAM protein [Thermodesulfobacteriota bacterium]